MGEFLERLGQLDQADLNNPYRAENAEGARLPRSRGRFINEAHRQAYLKELLEAAKFTDEVLWGHRPLHHFQEAMSTSDFPILFADILDRQVLARYREWPINLGSLVQERRAGSMTRSSKLFPQQYGADAKLDPVEQLTEYPEANVTEQSPIVIPPPVKYGRRFGISWEVLQDNDAVEQLRDIPQAFATAARRTEEDAVLTLFLGSAGPNATLYNNTNKNVVNTTNGAATNNPALSLTGLQDAMTVLSKQVDEQGYPILIDMVELVVPPALEVIANNILNAQQLELRADGGDANRTLIAANWMRNRFRLTVNPYIPQRASSNGNTSWFLFGRPDAAPGGRAAIYLQRLRGNEEPALFIKSPNAMRVGGGIASPMDGDFDTDAVEYKVRHILSAGLLDPKFTVASNGSGT